MTDVNESFIAQYYVGQQATADAINAYHAHEHDVACENAAINAIKTGNPPISVVAKPKVRPKPDSFPVGGFDDLTVPCSTKTPADFMPQPVSGEVGQGIGALIPRTTNKYYDRTNQHHESGEIRDVNGARYVYSRPTPFGGFWVKQ